MNIRDLREAQLYFEKQIVSVEDALQLLHNLREQFVNFYTPGRIQNMTLDQYAVGNDLPDAGYNFCYTLEQGLRGLGKIVGATAFKFGVYYGKTKSDSKYR